jgi:hypothetical protein
MAKGFTPYRALEIKHWLMEKFLDSIGRISSDN